MISPPPCVVHAAAWNAYSDDADELGFRARTTTSPEAVGSRRICCAIQHKLLIGEYNPALQQFSVKVVSLGSFSKSYHEIQ